ncbi:hypothetical protein NW768_010844 [Fusarium equiseti]|uniref:Zn(2)-C6 fungal-type domain-containing protein n=1 Tax=Fusarium equiseti TaxID=61235 RepID=A0ABQ8QYU5_FUSEQ|nr:hypothetical protein NW768_010844 [Fusarium equiseti]
MPSNLRYSVGRPILPAILPAGDPAPTVPSGIHPKRTLVSAACQACRKRKSKCSGTRPVCVACTKRSTDCQWEPTESQAIKRKYHEIVDQHSRASSYQQLFNLIKCMSSQDAARTVHRIQAGDDIEVLLDEAETSEIMPQSVKDYNVNAYEDFYRMLQSRPDEDFSRILRLVKSGYDVKAMLRHIREADLLLQMALKPEHRRRYEFPFNPKWPEFLRKEGNPYLQTSFYESDRPSPDNSTLEFKSDSIFDMPYHASILIEPLLPNMRISKWTAVTCDEGMLTSLLEHYFQHAYPFFTFFHKDLFLRDLNSGSAEYCSSLLVNAVLASATHYHPKVHGRNEPWDTESLCYRFFAETKRLWELEMGESKLTTCQAAMVMNSVYNMDGLDQIGNLYMVQAAKIAYNLDLFGAKGRGEMDVAKHFTAWCLFSWQSLMLFHFYKPPLFQKPPEMDLQDPHASPSFYPEIHVRYPESGSRPISFPDTFVQTVKFRVIMNDLANDRFGGGKNRAITLERAAAYYRRLCQWFEDLPGCLKPDRIVLPSHLDLHIHFQYIIMLLLEPFIASEKDNPSITLLDGMTKPVRAIVHEATIRFETLVRVYYLRHSFSTYAPVMIQFLSILGFLSARKAAASAGTTSDFQSSLILATMGLENQAQQAYIANAMFRVLFSKIPPGMADVTSQYCSLNSTRGVTEIQPAYVKSAYPIHMVSINADADEQRLNRLIEELKI